VLQFVSAEFFYKKIERLEFLALKEIEEFYLFCILDGAR